MNYFAFDTSAFAKRYHIEQGSSVVTAMITQLIDKSNKRVIISRIVVAEVISVLKRRFNSHQLTLEQFNTAVIKLKAETTTMTSLIINDFVADGRHSLILTHNINSADAMFLYQALQVSQILGQSNHRVWLVASDARLLRAAAKEGLAILDPESADVQFAQTLL